MVKFEIWYLYEITFGTSFLFLFFFFCLLEKTLLNLCKNDTLPSLTFSEGYVAYLYNKPRPLVGERRTEFFFVTRQISKERRFVPQRT